MERRITTPLTKDMAKSLKCGERVLLSGVIYTARDAAHKRLCEMVERGESLPFDTEGAVIYFVGPTPARPGRVIGSAGPTTSCRMDKYSPTLLSLGARGMIGKGERDAEVISAMIRNSGVYFGAIGGAGALISECIRSREVIAFEDLGTEAISRLTVVDMPLTVVIDTEGNDLYRIGREAARQKINSEE